MAEPRTAEQRRADTIAKLQETGADVWVASSSSSGAAHGHAHLVPLSYAWVNDEIVLALERTSKTAANIVASGETRLGFGPTRDVVMIDAALVAAEGVDTAPVGEAYAAQADWDPRGMAGMIFLRLRPLRIMAWREANELPGRTLMSGGEWRS